MTVRVGKLSNALMRRSIRLLDMEYKPSEMAEELGANKDQIIRMVTAGAPARKDSKGHYWIHGLKFSAWLETAAPKNEKAKRTFEDNEAFCFTCKSVVTFTETKRVGKVTHGKCQYGHKVARFYSSTPPAHALKADQEKQIIKRHDDHKN